MSKANFLKAGLNNGDTQLESYEKRKLVRAAAIVMSSMVSRITGFKVYPNT